MTERINNQSISEKNPGLPKIGNLTTGEQIIYPSGTNVIIDDVGIGSENRICLSKQLTPDVVFLEPTEMTGQLLGVLPRILLEDSQLAILYPLNGGRIVQKTLNDARSNVVCQQFCVKAERGRSNSDPDITLPQELLDQLILKQVTSILVLDDVIVTGCTLKAIQDEVYRNTDIVYDSQYSQSDRFGWIQLSTNRLKIAW